MRQREPRTNTYLSARLRTERGWHDVVIRNLSAHGAMLQLSSPPVRGKYVELRRATTVVVARVIWSEDARCGVSTRERIDVACLLDPAHAAPDHGPARRCQRRVPRGEHGRPVPSRDAGRFVELAASLMTAGTAAWVLISLVAAALLPPVHAVARALA